MSGWRVATGAFAVLLYSGLCFTVGAAVERHGEPVSVPVAEGDRTGSMVQQGDGSRCDLRDRQGYHKDDGCPVAYGKGFRVGYLTVRDGWTITPTGNGPVLQLTVTNDNPGSVAGFAHTFHLNRFDGSLTAIVWCSDDPAYAAGQSRDLVCKPLRPEPSQPYDNVQIS